MAELRKTAITKPDFLYIMDILKNSIMNNLNCIRIGRITEYDKVTNTCTVQIMMLRQFNESETVSYPPLSDVPLIILGGGSGELTFPSPVGNDCILLINDRDIDIWYEGGEAYQPNTTRTHSLSDCIALCGVRNLLNPLTDYDENATTLRNKNSKIKLSKLDIKTTTNGNIEIEAKLNNTLKAPATTVEGNLPCTAGYTGMVAAGNHLLNFSGGVLVDVQ